MAKKNTFGGPTRLVDAANGRPVCQFTASGHYYVRATATRHFWGRILDGAVFLAAYLLLAVLLAAGQLAAGGGGIPVVSLVVLWFVLLYVYGMVWGTWGLAGDRAARMRSVRIADGTLSGPWIGGWRAIAWSFLPLYIFFMIASLFDGGVDHTPGYVPLDLESGLAKGRQPVEDAALLAREQAQAQAHAQLPKLYGKDPDGRA
ncbi:hypothetical protein QO003_002668 [Arthrobacter silviterrae]|uniref:RDD family protein n=1 Tax=Arthrobacter silviterrae TaxID=2026658 RepID=A0ABX0D665_9MICC|nr:MULTISPECIES: hypothetical protein [Arthrobacter]MCU6480373.1 hypothetical protein [Arthrobacter sp. A2-55]MDQ0278365.1 hypothetical protein [Arthrobacter silviterrae]NGN82376.1 hypothetical protein [Arthrobacter silviterrae]